MHDEDLEYSRIMGLVDGILLNVYDSVAISKKWDKRDISMVTLQKKKDMLLYFKDYFKTDNWDTWTDIYCEYFCKNKYILKKRFEYTRQQSMRAVNRRIKLKPMNLSTT